MEMCEISFGGDFTETTEIDGLAVQAVLRSISKDGNADFLYKPPSAYTRQNSVNESVECNTVYIDKGNTNFRRLHEESEKLLDIISREKFIKPSYLKQISAISTVEEYLAKQTINDTVEEHLVKQTINDTVEDHLVKQTINDTVEEYLAKQTINDTVEDHLVKQTINDTVEEYLVKQTINDTVEEYLAKQTINDTVEEHLAKQTINDTVVNMPGECPERCAYSSNDSGLSRDNYGAKKSPWLQRGACIFALSGFSCVLSVLTVAFMMLLLNRVSSYTDGDTLEIVQSMGQSYQGKPTSEVHIAGSFRLNQTYLHEHSNVRWLPDEHSKIIPSRSNDCLIVPCGGKYLVVSRFTFNILPKDGTPTLTHIFKLKTRTGDMKDGGFKRKYVSMLENRLRSHSETEAHLELRKASVFIEFFLLDAEDQICANVSNPDLLYESAMDNDINIIKV